MKSFLITLTLLASVLHSAAQPDAPLTTAQADAFARLALSGIVREFPNKPGEVLTRAEDLRTPRAMHPAFYGCYDWHSAVHGHWMLVRLLKLHPGMTNAALIRSTLAGHLTAPNLQVETAYFEQKQNRGFERMYGWAWALRLAAELRSWDDPQARKWAANIAPLERRLVEQTRDYLPRLTYPIRTGVHPNTAFALGQILDYARNVGDASLEGLIRQRAKDYFLNDRDYPTHYEPSGEDFFSGGLNVADLMRRVLNPAEFSAWLDGYMPSLRSGDLKNWSVPAEVSDLSDPRIVHLVGLNLSRAWTLQGIAASLPGGDARRQRLETAMNRHAEAGFKYVFSGHYEGEHWLATFAVYFQSKAGVENRAKP